MFSKSSKLKLATCDVRLQQLITDVMAHVDAGALAGEDVLDLTVLCGYRGKAEQDKAFRDGASTKLFPHSKHNRVPSMAVDIAPYPIPRTPQGAWDDKSPKWEAVRKLVLERASALGIRIRVISWDLPHYELVT